MAAPSPAPRPAPAARLWDADTLEAVPAHQILLQDQEYLVRRRGSQRVCCSTSTLGWSRCSLRQLPQLIPLGRPATIMRPRPHTPSQAQHQLDKLFGGLLTELLKQRPADPLTFMIDTLALGPEHAAQVCRSSTTVCCWCSSRACTGGRAHPHTYSSQDRPADTHTNACAAHAAFAQDPETGLPQHRKEQLLLVFKIIEKVCCC